MSSVRLLIRSLTKYLSRGLNYFQRLIFMFNFIQILGTMVLVIAIYSATDKLNGKVPAHLIPLYISIALVGIGCSLGINQGFACNPARDLAPRIFTYISDWGSDVFS